MIKKEKILAFTFLFLYGCVGNSHMNSNEDLERKSPADDPVKITEETIGIALSQGAIGE